MDSQRSLDSVDINDLISRSLLPPLLRSKSSSAPSLTVRRRQVSSSVPIEHQYELNNKVLTLFDKTYRKGQWLVCYEIGRNFVETALFEIPKHGYYNNKRHKNERLQASFDALRVTDLLQLISQRLSNDEKQFMLHSSNTSQVDAASSPESFKAESEKLNEIAKKQADEETLSNYMNLRDEILAGAGKGIDEASNQVPGNNLERKESCTLADIFKDLKNLNLCGYLTACVINVENEPIVVTSPTPALTRKSRSGLMTSSTSLKELQQPAQSVMSASTTSEKFHCSSIYPTLDEVAQNYYNDDVGGVRDDSLVDDMFDELYIIPETKTFRQSSVVFAVQEQRQCYWEDWQALKNKGKILFTYLETYQGRYPASTNGCTVIAPLLAIHHLQSEGPGIADATIDEVIDDQATEILPQVRAQLGLTKDALIIPSDVHDYLIQIGLLNQDQFVGVCGGDITEDAHVYELFQTLNGENDGKKVAAALFFHGHVISILKMNFPDGRSWYDVIDSLPSAFTMTGTKEETGWNKCAVRIRCKDLESLETTLKWYSWSKFSDEECEFIGLYPWDDNRAAFDPRVFQAFVWAEWASRGRMS